MKKVRGYIVVDDSNGPLHLCDEGRLCCCNKATLFDTREIAKAATVVSASMYGENAATYRIAEVVDQSLGGE